MDPQPSAEQQRDAFIAHIRDERRLATRTVENYSRELRALQRWWDENRAERQALEWSALQANDLRAFAAHLHRHGRSARSVAAALSAIRSFYRFLLRERQVRKNPAEGISAPKAAKRLPRVIDADQAAGLLDFSPEDDLEVRDKAIFELAYSSGLRVSELASVRITDLDAREGLIEVLGKGNAQRIVPVGGQALRAIAAWQRLRAQWVSTDSDSLPLFISQRGGPMSTSAIRARLTRLVTKLGLGTHISPHMLRHSVATQLVSSSGDLRAVQEFLGHKNLSTTQVYTHLDFGHLSRLYDRCHPRASRNKKTD